MIQTIKTRQLQIRSNYYKSGVTIKKGRKKPPERIYPRNEKQKINKTDGTLFDVRFRRA